jgi:hypothetical protein
MFGFLKAQASSRPCLVSKEIKEGPQMDEAHAQKVKEVAGVAYAAGAETVYIYFL